MLNDSNLEKYETNEVVDFYKQQEELQPCEQYLFAKYIKNSNALLDIGVGGGRTSPYLADMSKEYLGGDYSEAMVSACQEKYPELKFALCDATSMINLSDGQFDVVVFSFNGIDVIRTDAERASAFSEISRILKSGGIFIFSSHNAKVLGVWPRFKDSKFHQKIWRTFLALKKTVQLGLRAFGNSNYKNGEGYINDPVHGGMHHYVSTPETIKPQLEAVGLEVLEVVNGHYPDVSSANFAPWWYYAAQKK